MHIGFYAPLKAPDHPVPSGDRQMARLLIAAVRHAGHAVTILSTLRCYASAPDPAVLSRIEAQARDEAAAIGARWLASPSARPDLIFVYHLYYKAPDLIGFALAQRFGLPYATAEASYAAKRETGPWRAGNAHVEQAVRAAAVNFCFTANDRLGLAEIVDSPERLIDLPPFIDAGRYGPKTTKHSGRRTRLITVAMMRPGDKLDSYRFLAAALDRLRHRDWHLTIVGDGPARAEVEQAFAPLPQDRLDWRGALADADVAAALQGADLLAWPGFNEAFGLSYLEAQGCGLPVVAVTGEGTPSVVRHGETGLLTANRLEDYVAALDRLLADPGLCQILGRAAYRFVHEERTLAGAAARIQVELAGAFKANQLCC
jgi:glycosyltransferase involved in cell wall biosynthesis